MVQQNFRQAAARDDSVLLAVGLGPPAGVKYRQPNLAAGQYLGQFGAAHGAVCPEKQLPSVRSGNAVAGIKENVKLPPFQGLLPGFGDRVPPGFGPGTPPGPGRRH